MMEILEEELYIKLHYQELDNTKDYSSTLEQELKWLREFTGREIVQNIINTLKEENDYLFHKAYDLD